jgi:DNA-binding NarL/FixJ family response regulator
MDPRKIVLIDDHNIFRNSLKIFLETTGDYIITGDFNNGSDGIRFIESEQPDLVILDVDMPQVSGIQTLRILKEKIPALPILILSYYDNPEIQHKALLEGASGILSKSSDLGDLTIALDQILQEGIYVPQDIGRLMLQKKKQRKPELSAKEMEMISLLLKEHKIEEIAEKLHITKRTAENLRMKIKEKLGVKTTYGLVQYVIDNGLMHFSK